MSVIVRNPTVREGAKKDRALPAGRASDTIVARPAESRAELRRCATRPHTPGTAIQPPAARQPNRKVKPCWLPSSRHHSASAVTLEQKTFRYKLRRRFPCSDVHTLAQKRIASWRLPFPRAAPRERQ